MDGDELELAGSAAATLGPLTVEPELQLDELAPELQRLQAALGELGEAFQAAREAGWRPADALRACGIEVPALAAPMLNQVLP